MYWPLLPHSRTTLFNTRKLAFIHYFNASSKKDDKKKDALTPREWDPPSPPLLLHARTHTHTLTSYLCWDRRGEKKSAYTLNSSAPPWTFFFFFFASKQLWPASALEVARLSVRAPADPYQPLLFNSLHIHDTSTYSSCKMQMPLSCTS